MTKEEFDKLPALRPEDCVEGALYVAAEPGDLTGDDPSYNVYTIGIKGDVNPVFLQRWISEDWKPRKLLRTADGRTVGGPWPQLEAIAQASLQDEDSPETLEDFRNTIYDAVADLDSPLNDNDYVEMVKVLQAVQAATDRMLAEVRDKVQDEINILQKCL